MKLAASLPVPMPSIDTLKMEDRKRPALDDDGRAAPPLKKQALSVNGGQHPDTDMPWKDDIEDYTKDAALREMKQYKRKAETAKEELEDVRKQAKYHNEHLRTIDSWFEQLVDEVSLVCNEVPVSDKPEPFTAFDSSLFTAKSEKFEQHLREKSDQIKQAVSRIFSQHAKAEPDVAKLQERISQLMAAEKQHKIDLQDLQDQATALDEQLENASMRYMKAEKKMDRLQSGPVQKLEAQAKQPPKLEPEESSASGMKGDDANQVNGISPEMSAEAEAAKKEAIAARDKMKEHVEKLTAESNKLRDDLSATKSKSATLSDEEYSHTELYKAFKNKYADLIKRFNDLQSVNMQLRAEIKDLQAHQTKYREEVEKEQKSAIEESESQVTRLSLDLARIRNERDNHLQQLAVIRAEMTDRQESKARDTELQAAKDERITSLESEIERVRQSADGKSADNDGDLTSLGIDEVRSRLRQAENEKKMLLGELGGMESSYKKAIAAGSQKLSTAVNSEEQVARLTAEKEKANQKYFQTERAKAAQLQELRALRQQQTKTTEIVAQAKETESQRRNLTTQLEKNIAELKDQLADVEKNHRDLQQREYDFKTKSERFATQVAELQKQVTSKDDIVKTSQQNSRQCETETAELRVRLAETEKSLEVWRKRSMGAKNEEYDMLKQIATCTICRKNFKEVALTKCGHVFCQQCVDERYNSRARKCPNCSAPFGQNDRIKVTL